MFPIFLSASGGSWDRNPNNGIPRQDVLVSAGGSHTLAIKNGIIWVWGDNQYGQLGLGFYPIAFPPTQIVFNDEYSGQPLDPQPQVIAVAAGWRHSLALTADGKIWGWGDNTHGQVGLFFSTPDPNDPNNSYLPSSIVSPVCITSSFGLKFIAIAAGKNHSLAIDERGQIWSWGWNINGQCGLENDLPQLAYNSPREVVNLNGKKCIAISAGESHSIAINSDGTVWAWGANNYGQLSQSNTFASTSTPVQVKTLNNNYSLQPIQNIIAISAGSSCEDVPAPRGFSLALRADGTVWAWGYNGDKAAIPSLPMQTFIPTATQLVANSNNVPLHNVIAVTAGSSHSIALKSDGNIWGWGDDSDYQLANNQINPSYPIQVNRTESTATITAGCNFSIVLQSNGNIRGWGINNTNQTGTTPPPPCPTCPVLFPPPVIKTPTDVPGMQFPYSDKIGVLAISSGQSFNIALKDDGMVYVWGWGGTKVIGDGSIIDNPAIPTNTAVRIVQYKNNLFDPPKLLTNVVAISAGNEFVLALRVDGTIWAWGNNNSNQLGIGMYPSSGIAYPVQYDNGNNLEPISNIVSISAGYQHSLAISADGRVWAWGDNSISIGAFPLGHLHGYKADLMSTPGPWVQQLNSIDHAIPVTNNPIEDVGTADIQNVVTCSAGFAHSLILLANGTVQAWGSNSIGKLGNGSTLSTALINPQTVQKESENGYVTLTDIKSIATNHFTHHKYQGDNAFSLALATDGFVWSWGANDFGQLGVGDLLPHYGAKKTYYLPDCTRAKKIAAGITHSMFCTAGGNIYSFGANKYGQLGTPKFKYDDSDPLGPWLYLPLNDIECKFNIPTISFEGTDYDAEHKLMPKYSYGSFVADGRAIQSITSIGAGTLQSLTLLADGTMKTCGGDGVMRVTGHNIHMNIWDIVPNSYSDFYDYPNCSFLNTVNTNDRKQSSFLMRKIDGESLFYPNPVVQGQQLLIQPSSEQRQTYTLNITNMLGSSVYSGEVLWNGKGNNIEIPTSTIPPGMYTVTLRSGEIQEAYQVIIIH